MTDTATKVLWWQFFNPERLWLLLAIMVLAIGYVLLLRLRTSTGIRYTNTGLMGAVMPRQRSWKRHVSVAMTLLSLVTLTGAWARPAGTQKVPRERATIVVVLDVSLSMQATDISPTRLDAAKTAARQFIDTLPPQYNVAVVSLSATPATVVPPTTDRAMTNLTIDRLTMQNGTAIGDAINAGLSALKLAPPDPSHPNDPAPGLMVLLSDGTNTDGADPIQAAQRAAERKVPIYTIAFGTANGYVDVDHQRENVAPDTTVLRQIASMSGGQELDAKSAGALKDVYQKIHSQVGYENVKTEVTTQWCLYALAFAVVAALGAVSMATRWP